MEAQAAIAAPREAGWRTYLKLAVFIAPPLLAWAFSALYIYPKLQQLWVDSKMMDSEFQWIMGLLHLAMEQTKTICVLLIVLLVALEFTGDWWPRYRKSVVGAMLFLFNTAIILGLTGAGLVAAIAGPALIHR
jgi:hypothetical protein